MDTLPITIAAATVASWFAVASTLLLRSKPVHAGLRLVVSIWVLPLSALLTINLLMRLFLGYEGPTRIFSSTIAMFYIFAFVVTGGYLFTNRKQ